MLHAPESHWISQRCGCLPEQAVHPTGPDRVAARRALPRPAMPKKIVDELFIIAPSVVSPLHLQAGNGAPFDGPWAPPHARPAPAQAPAVRRLQSAPAVRHKPPPPQPQEWHQREEERKRAVATQLPQQLEALHKHRQNGILTDEEFLAAKCSLLSLATGTPAERLGAPPEPPKSAPVSPRHRPSPRWRVPSGEAFTAGAAEEQVVRGTAPAGGISQFAPAPGPPPPEYLTAARLQRPAVHVGSGMQATGIMRRQQRMYDEVQEKSMELYKANGALIQRYEELAEQTAAAEHARDAALTREVALTRELEGERKGKALEPESIQARMVGSVVSAALASVRLRSSLKAAGESDDDGGMSKWAGLGAGLAPAALPAAGEVSDQPLDVASADRARRAAMAAARRGEPPARVLELSRRAAAERPPDSSVHGAGGGGTGEASVLTAFLFGGAPPTGADAGAFAWVDEPPLIDEEAALHVVAELAAACGLNVGAAQEVCRNACENEGVDPLLAALAACAAGMGTTVEAVSAAMAAASVAASGEPAAPAGAIASAAIAAAQAARGATTSGEAFLHAAAGRVACAKVADEGCSPREAVNAAAELTERAAVAVAQARADQMVVMTIPRWSLSSWFAQLDLTGVVCEAMLKRLTAGLQDGGQAAESTGDFEWRFVEGLAKALAEDGADAAKETVLSILKETPVLEKLAEAIASAAGDLASQMAEAEASGDSAAQAGTAPIFAGAAAVAMPTNAPNHTSKTIEDSMDPADAGADDEVASFRMAAAGTPDRDGSRPNSHISPTNGSPEKGSARATPVRSSSPPELASSELRGSEQESPPISGGSHQASPEELNEIAQKSGAFTLAYSTDTALYWGGVDSLLGHHDQTRTSLLDGMTNGHTRSSDSDEYFTPNNYPTPTTSRIEWYFVVDPQNGLGKCGLTEWPGTIIRGDSNAPPRLPRTVMSFATERALVDARLHVVGEQPLSNVELYALRLYTGPMFVKYNSVLRAKVLPDNPFFRSCAAICKDNNYQVTIAVLTASIIKLGKIEKALVVYRAPGGALPSSFWKADPSAGTMGGIEAAFMSTTTAKKEALHYAMRGAAKVLFEIRQGIVARGASVSWLSQYPAEAEILFPPLTALEMNGSRVDGAVIVVELIASMRPPESIETGHDDIQRFERERAAARIGEQRRRKHLQHLQNERDAAREDAALLQAQLASERCKSEANKSREAITHLTGSIKLLASRRQSHLTRAKLEEKAKAETVTKLHLAKTEEEKMRYERELETRQLAEAESLAQVAELQARLERADEAERHAREQHRIFETRHFGQTWKLKAKETMSKLRSSSNKELADLRAQLETLKQDSAKKGILGGMGKSPAPAEQDDAEAEENGRKRVPGPAEIAEMKPAEVTATLVKFAAKTTDELDDATARSVVACFQRVLAIASQGGGGGVFGTDKKTIPSIVALMESLSTDPAVQLRGCQVLHKLLCVSGMTDLARTSGAIRAVVRAVQLLSVHGMNALRVTAQKKDKQNVEAAIQAIKEVCDHDDKALKKWLGLEPKGFLALPEAVGSDEAHVKNATAGKKWQSSKAKWIVIRGL